MMIDSAFWVAISFVIFILILIYFKIPQKIKTTLDKDILDIKNQINEAEKLKEEAKNILTDHEKKISNSKKEIKGMIDKANIEAEKKHNHLMATNWDYAIKEHIKTGLESPIPYKVIPYKNGRGIKKIEFFKPIKNGSL